ncbi:MAG: type II toxin-antitoxin system PemK/MazF family toxin [Minisyncoccia bacterium]
MEKDFDAWNEQKKSINAREDVLLYRERDVRWCQLGVNVGFEQDGTGTRRSRPVLVLKAFSRSVCLVVPLTTARKKNPYYVSLGKVGGQNASAIISQLRLIDTKRLDQKIGGFKKEVFERVRKAVKAML